MAQQYSPRAILRHAANALLDRYFHEQDLLMELDIAGLEETGIDPVYAAWQALPDDQRAQIDSDFRLVHLVADEDGIVTILEEARFHGEDLEPKFSELDGFVDKALWTLVERSRYIDIAGRFREADALPGNYWLRRRDGVPTLAPRDTEPACDELARNVSGYFQLKEGRGHHCVVEVYKRGDRYYYFAYLEDYARTEMEFEGERLQRRPHRPAFEVVFVYSPDEEALDTFSRGPRATSSDLQEIFGRVALSTELGQLSKDERVYDFNMFKRRGVPFVYDPSSGIQDVRVKLLRLSLIGGEGRRLTIEADTSRDRGALYDLLDRAMDTGAGMIDPRRGALPLTLANVTRVGIQVELKRGGRRGKPTKTFYLTYPNGCTLKHEGRDEFLRQMLIDSGIEPAKPKHEAQSD